MKIKLQFFQILRKDVHNRVPPPFLPKMPYLNAPYIARSRLRSSSEEPAVTLPAGS
jgi:hypothetical protein